MTEEEVKKLIAEEISKIDLKANFEGDNYGGSDGHLTISIVYDGFVIASDSVIVK